MRIAGFCITVSRKDSRIAAVFICSESLSMIINIIISQLIEKSEGI